MKNQIVRRLTANAIVAALYFVLTWASSPIAFLGIQVRISEFLLLLCFFNKDYIAGVTIGTLLANLMSPMLPWDLIFGTLATLIAMIYNKKTANIIKIVKSSASARSLNFIYLDSFTHIIS